MKYILLLTILFSSNCFADAIDIIEQSEQESRQMQIERRIDNLEQQKSFDDLSRQMDNMDLSFPDS